MKLRVPAAVAVVTLVTIALACSSRPSQPPIDTNGGIVPQPGGSTPGTNGDAGTVVANDAGVIDAGDAGPAEDAANNCHFGSCAGCCSSPATGGQCKQGQTDDQCGLGGAGCQACDAGAHCIDGTCL